MDLSARVHKLTSKLSPPECIGTIEQLRTTANEVVIHLSNCHSATRKEREKYGGLAIEKIAALTGLLGVAVRSDQLGPDTATILNASYESLAKAISKMGRKIFKYD